MAVLTRRDLNRATLARQGLLERGSAGVVETLEHLVGLQAQTPHTWYVGLWNRIAGFRAEDASDLLERREIVRIAVMRGTIHLVTARDALALRPHFTPVFERTLKSQFGRNLVGVDRDELQKAGREILEAQPCTFAELGRRLAVRWPDNDPASLAQAIRAWEPLVQVTPRGLWGRSGTAAHTTAQAWLGPVDVSPTSIDDVVRRYLGAFGPASVRDVQTWSTLTRLAEVLDRMRPGLATFTDQDGRELFDLPDAPRPDPESTPAPARLLYDFDNLVLSHDDRTRVITPAYANHGWDPNGPMPRIVLVDGMTAATWTVESSRGLATLTVHPLQRLRKADVTEVTVEAEALLDFLAPASARHDVVVLPFA